MRQAAHPADKPTGEYIAPHTIRKGRAVFPTSLWRQLRFQIQHDYFEGVFGEGLH